jgi:hypothetical protein
MANIALQDGKVVLKDGKASCSCCGVVCPPIESDYTVISEAMFNALQAGGNYFATGGASEYTGCSFSGTENAIVPSENCGASAGVQGGITCNSQGFNYRSSIGINWNISQVGSEYRFTYNGGGSCWSDVYEGLCYTVGFYINWSFDNFPPPGSFTKVGTVTLTTSAGSMNFGIWNLDNTASASLGITITPFSSP